MLYDFFSFILAWTVMIIIPAGMIVATLYRAMEGYRGGMTLFLGTLVGILPVYYWVVIHLVASATGGLILEVSR